ncbi:hypothetical protein MNBD_GAMMA09-635, partial [hydrothermal vent metagenome]
MEYKHLKQAAKILSTLLFLSSLYACGSDDNNTAKITASNSRIDIPEGLQKLTLTGVGILRAYATIDGDTANRTEMTINPGGAGSASVSIPGLSRAPHTIFITYEYVYSDGTILTLANVSRTVDLSSGSGSLSVAASEYDTSMDYDNDGISNVKEMAAGSDPQVAAVPVTAALPTLGFAAVKTFRFSWTDVGDATHYRLTENPDGSSGFTQVGSDIPPGTQNIDHVVPLYARVNAQYILQSCNAMGCTDSASVSVSGTLVSSTGYFKASNTEAGDLFGYTVSLSADGSTLAVGAPYEDSNSSGINGDQTDNSALQSGAVYLYSRSGSSWSQQAYIKASNTEASDYFGWALSLSADGNTLAVGAYREDSNASGINGDQSDNSAAQSGAVYL